MWEYEGYWKTVMGANRDAARVVAEFTLEANGLAEWLARTERYAWRAGGNDGAMPEEWRGFFLRALSELQAALTVSP